MAIISGSVNKTSANIHRRLQGGRTIVDITEIYDVRSDTANENAEVIESAAGIPSIGDEVTTASGIRMFCVDKYATRQQNQQTFWEVTVFYTSELERHENKYPVRENGTPATDPTQAAQEVDFQYVTIYVPTTEAEFVRIEDRNGTERDAPPYLVAGERGAIVTSALEWIPDQKRRFTYRNYKVSRIVKQWPASWDAIIDNTNLEALTITERDTDGTTLFSTTFQPGQVLLDNITKQNLRIGGDRFYRATFNLLVDTINNHETKVPDMGTMRRVFNGQYQSDGSQWNPAEIFALGRQRMFAITDGEANVTQPVPLNGYGELPPIERPDGAYDEDNPGFKLVYRYNERVSFGPLGIT